jgi:preprotein translocase subunit SecG
LNILEIAKIALQVLQALSAVMLIFLVLIHSPKGDGIGSIGSATQLFSSQKGAEATLNNITMWAAGIFFASSFILGYYLTVMP